jgi:hypothetical protein
MIFILPPKNGLMFGKEEVVGKLGVVWEIPTSKDAIDFFFLPDTELEGASTEQRTLEEGDLKGHGPKTDRNAITGGGGGRGYMLRTECRATNET